MAEVHRAGRGVIWWLGMAARTLVAAWVMVVAFAIAATVTVDNVADRQLGWALLSLALAVAGPAGALATFLQLRHEGARPGDDLMRALFYGTLASLPALILLGPSTVI